MSQEAKPPPQVPVRPEVSLESLAEELSRSVGVVRRTHLGVVRADDFRRFAFAVGDVSGRCLRDVRPEAPDLFVSSQMGWGAGPVESQLRPDGSNPAATVDLPVEGRALMGAGQELQFGRAVLDGDELWVEMGVEQVSVKGGSSGDFILLTILRRYMDAAGEQVLSCHEKLVVR